MLKIQNTIGDAKKNGDLYETSHDNLCELLGIEGLLMDNPILEELIADKSGGIKQSLLQEPAFALVNEGQDYRGGDKAERGKKQRGKPLNTQPR